MTDDEQDIEGLQLRLADIEAELAEMEDEIGQMELLAGPPQPVDVPSLPKMRLRRLALKLKIANFRAAINLELN